MTAVAKAEMFAHFRDGYIEMSGYQPFVVILFWDLPYGMVLIQFFGSEMTDCIGPAAGQGAGCANEVVPDPHASIRQMR